MKKIIGVLKITKSELISGGLMMFLVGMGLALLSIISLIVPASDNPLTGTKTIHIDAAKGQLLSAIGQISTYAFLTQLFLAFKDKSAIDKNRALFLMFGKGSVSIGKLIKALIGYLFPMLIVLILAPVLLMVKYDGFFETVNGIPTLVEFGVGDWVAQEVIFSLTMCFFFAIVLVVSKWIHSTQLPKVKKWIIILIWITLTVDVNMVFGILVPIVDEVGDFVKNNIKWMCAIPFLNAMTPFTVLAGSAPLWTMAPMMAEILIALIVMWKPYSTTLKEYLCC